MYLDQVNYELNKKINDFVCNSNDAPTPEERIDILKQAWELLPKPATQFVEPTSAIACGISENYKKLGDYQKALEWMLIALEARKDEPVAGVFIWTGIVYYELGDMENAYKYFDLTYNELRYTPFSMEDKKYWQFYKQRKEKLNPKKKTKK